MKSLITLLFLSFVIIGYCQFKLDNRAYQLELNYIDADVMSAKTVFKKQLVKKVGKIDSSEVIYYKVITNLPFSLEGKQQKQFFISTSPDAKKLYVQAFNSDAKKHLLYDFTLQPGDTLNSALCAHPLVLIEIKDNEYHFKAVGVENSRVIKMYAGIGTEEGFLINIIPEISSVSVLSKVTDNGKVIYKR